MILTFALAQLLRRVPGNAHMVVQEAILGWHLPTNIAPHARSHAAFVEVLYGVSWVTKGYWQPFWRA